MSTSAGQADAEKKKLRNGWRAGRQKGNRREGVSLYPGEIVFRDKKESWVEFLRYLNRIIQGRLRMKYRAMLPLFLNMQPQCLVIILTMVLDCIVVISKNIVQQRGRQNTQAENSKEEYRYVLSELLHFTKINFVATG